MTKHKLIALGFFLSGNINQFLDPLFPLMEMRQLANKKLGVIDKRIKRDSLHSFCAKSCKKLFPEQMKMFKQLIIQNIKKIF